MLWREHSCIVMTLGYELRNMFTYKITLHSYWGDLYPLMNTASWLWQHPWGPRSQVAAILAAMSRAYAALQEWPAWCRQTGLALPFPSTLCLANSLDTSPHARAVLMLCVKSCLLACDLRDLILRTPCGTSLMDRIDTGIMRECEKKMI